MQFRGACVVRGRMPGALLDAWLAEAEVRKVGARRRMAQRERDGIEEEEEEEEEEEDGVGGRDPRRVGRGGYAGEAQLWCVVEMADAGVSVEDLVRRGKIGVHTVSMPKADRTSGKRQDERRRWVAAVEKAWDVVWQVVRALACGEAYAGFEHRDLHLGNLCVREIDDDGAVSGSLVDVESIQSSVVERTPLKTSPPPRRSTSRPPSSRTNVVCTERRSTAAQSTPFFTACRTSPPFSLRTTAFETTLIDYSLSRACVLGDSVVAYDFLGDKALVLGHGALQYDMYRHVADVLKADDESPGTKQPESETRRQTRNKTTGPRNWTRKELHSMNQAFHPKTNVLWLWFLVRSLLGMEKEQGSQLEEHDLEELEERKRAQQ